VSQAPKRLYAQLITVISLTWLHSLGNFSPIVALSARFTSPWRSDRTAPNVFLKNFQGVTKPVETMTIIAVDVGTVRVGCAAADETVRIPFPVAVWPRAQARAERELLNILKERQATLLVVGLPLDPNGHRTPICENIEGFIRRIAKRAVIKIVYVDEAFSSVEATQRAAQSFSSVKEVDAFAACLILERYFESLAHGSPQS
jgi:putative Holliday junction resolvase